MSLRDNISKQLKVEVRNGNDLYHIERIPTGIAALDIILGGGLPKGRVVQIWGAESVGKTALCLGIVRGIQEREPEAECVYVDAEGTVNKDDIETHGLDPERILLPYVYGGEQAIDVALKSLELGARLAVIDSVPLLRPKKVLEEIQKDSSYRDISSVALLFERVQQKIVRTLEQSGGCLILINQQRPPKSQYEAPSYPGGSALRFMLSCSVHITSASRDKDNPDYIQQHLLIRKNKTFRPSLRADIPLLNRIVQRGRCLLLQAKEYDIVVQKGAHYSLNADLAKELGVETKLGQGEEKAGLALEANKAVYEKVYEQVLVASRALGIPVAEPIKTVVDNIYDQELEL